MMKKEIKVKGITLEYYLTVKNVKNINLLIKENGEIFVSVNKRVPQKVIEDFLLSKSDFILNALIKFKNKKNHPKTEYFSEKEIKKVIAEFCEEVYPYYAEKDIKFPTIKFRKMKSRWGSCNYIKGIITFNTNLMYVPTETVKYVVLHEYTHFLQPNHSQDFYVELEKVCPDWKTHRDILKEISVR